MTNELRASSVGMKRAKPPVCLCLASCVLLHLALGSFSSRCLLGVGGSSSVNRPSLFRHSSDARPSLVRHSSVTRPTLVRHSSEARPSFTREKQNSDELIRTASANARLDKKPAKFKNADEPWGQLGLSQTNLHNSSTLSSSKFNPRLVGSL
jgi:hypothetical protein